MIDQMRLFCTLAILLLTIQQAFAQSSPNLSYGEVPTAAQWNSYFSAKQDVLNFPPVNKNGDTMLGEFNAAPSTTSSAGLNLGIGQAPTSPQNGDIWMTPSGIFAHVGGMTIGPFGATSLPVGGNAGSVYASLAPINQFAIGLGQNGKIVYAQPLVGNVLGATAHVPTNAALRTWTTYAQPVIRDGFYAAGDGGAATYVHSSSPCSQNSGQGDNGWQVRDAAGAGCWIADIAKPVSAFVWGVKADGSTNDLPAWTAAIAAMGAMNGGTIVMPSSGSCSVLASTLRIMSSNVRIVGAGPDASCWGLTFAKGNGVEVGGDPGASAYVHNVTISNVAVVALVARTSGANLSVYRAINTRLVSTRCTGPYWICRATDGTLSGQQDTLDTEDSFLTAEGGGNIGVCIGCLYTTATTTTSDTPAGSTQMTLASTSGMYVGQYLNTPNGSLGLPGTLSLLNYPITAISGNVVQFANATSADIPSGTAITVIQRPPVSTVLHHLELTNNAVAAEELQNVGGLSQDAINTDFNGIGLWANPVTGQQVSGVFSDKVAYDASGTNGILFDTSGGGIIQANVFNSQWVASCGSPITQGIVNTINPSSCVKFMGPAGTDFEETMQLHVGSATAHCVEMDGSARDITLTGMLQACSFQNGNSYNGININGATHVSWNGQIGVTSNVPGVYPNTFAYSVAIEGASDYIRVAGDIGRDGEGVPIFNNATGTHFDYSEVIPAQVPLQSLGGGPLETIYSGVTNPNVVNIYGGNSISFCPALSCIDSSSDNPGILNPSFFGHQITSALFSTTTNIDGQAEEQTVAITTTIATGYHKPYAASTAYNVGDNVVVGNAVYRAVVAGTTGASSVPPSTRPTTAQGGSYQVTDGSVTWQWINDAAIDAKVGLYDETNVVAGAGSAWGAAFNYHIRTTPLAGMFLPGLEMDYSNDSGQACGLGVTDCTALRLAMAGSQVTEGLQVTGNASGSTYSAIWALRINGDMIASQSAIEVDAAAPVGLAFGVSGIGGQSHSVATIQDVTNSPASIDIGGTHNIAAILDASTSQNGIALNGTYAGAQIVGKNFVLSPTGALQLSGLPSSPPSGTRANGICIDTNGNLYKC